MTRQCTSDIISTSLEFIKKKADRLFSFTRIFGKIPLTADTWGQVLDWMRGLGRDGQTASQWWTWGILRVVPAARSLQDKTCAVPLGLRGQREVICTSGLRTATVGLYFTDFGTSVMYILGPTQQFANDKIKLESATIITNILMCRGIRKLSRNERRTKGKIRLSEVL